MISILLAGVFGIALLLALEHPVQMLLFRRKAARRRYRVGYWIQTERHSEALHAALGDALAERGIAGVVLHEQAADELYRNTHWRDRIGWYQGELLNLVAVGRLRAKPTNDIGNPYAWVLDFRYFYPANGAELSGGGLAAYLAGGAGEAGVLTAKQANEILKALWLMDKRPRPPAPVRQYDTSSWPFTENLGLR